MPILTWKAGGAPPSGPGIAIRVLAATWFQWITSLASVVGGAAETLTTPSEPRSAPIATGMNAKDRLRDIVLLLVVLAWMGRAIAPSFAPPTTERDRGDGSHTTFDSGPTKMV